MVEYKRTLSLFDKDYNEILIHVTKDGENDKSRCVLDNVIYRDVLYGLVKLNPRYFIDNRFGSQSWGFYVMYKTIREIENEINLAEKHFNEVLKKNYKLSGKIKTQSMKYVFEYDSNDLHLFNNQLAKEEEHLPMPIIFFKKQVGVITETYAFISLPIFVRFETISHLERANDVVQ